MRPHNDRFGRGVSIEEIGEAVTRENLASVDSLKQA